MRHEVYMGAARWPKPPNNSLQPWTPAPHRRCGENARTPAQTAHLPSRRTSGRCGGRCQEVLGLRLTRLACGKLKRALPARMRENERTVARAAGRLSSRPLCRILEIQSWRIGCLEKSYAMGLNPMCSCQ